MGYCASGYVLCSPSTHVRCHLAAQLTHAAALSLPGLSEAAHASGPNARPLTRHRSHQGIPFLPQRVCYCCIVSVRHAVATATCVCTQAHLGGPAFVNPATPLSNSGTGHSKGQSWTAATTPSLRLDSTLASFMLTCWPRVHGTDLVCMPSTQLCTATTAADLLPHFWTHTVCVFDTKRGSPPRVPVLAKPFVGPGSGPPPGVVPPRKPRGHQGGGPRAGGAGRGGGGAGGGAGASPAP